MPRASQPPHWAAVLDRWRKTRGAASKPFSAAESYSGSEGDMNFELSGKVTALAERLTAFMEEFVYPNESPLQAEVEANRHRGDPWAPVALLEELKSQARARQLWNLFLPESPLG